jgi:hypothetical protein
MAGSRHFPYKRPMQSSRHDNSLGELSVPAFLEGFAFRDLVIRKLNDLNPSDVVHQRLEGAVRVLLDMIEQSRQRRYRGMPLGMFARALIELERFVQIDDERPDTRVNGYSDDHARVFELCADYQGEIQSFREWRKSQPEDYTGRARVRFDLDSYPEAWA